MPIRRTRQVEVPRRVERLGRVNPRGGERRTGRSVLAGAAVLRLSWFAREPPDALVCGSRSREVRKSGQRRARRKWPSGCGREDAGRSGAAAEPERPVWGSSSWRATLCVGLSSGGAAVTAASPWPLDPTYEELGGDSFLCNACKRSVKRLRGAHHGCLGSCVSRSLYPGPAADRAQRARSPCAATRRRGRRRRSSRCGAAGGNHRRRRHSAPSSRRRHLR
jgi:hypothetical protein